MKNKFFIYGVAGAGKSWFSLHLKRDLDLPLLSGDYIRSVAQLEANIEDNPELYYNHDYVADNPIQDILNIRRLVKPHFLHEINFYIGGIIVEGSCLDPNITRELGKTVLIITEDESQHQKQYFQYRAFNDKTIAKFKVKRLKQEYLIKEAKKLGIPIINNSGTIEQMLKQFHTLG